MYLLSICWTVALLTLDICLSSSNWRNWKRPQAIDVTKRPSEESENLQKKYVFDF